jgi:Dynactin subunit p22
MSLETRLNDIENVVVGGKHISEDEKNVQLIERMHRLSAKLDAIERSNTASAQLVNCMNQIKKNHYLLSKTN